MLVLSFFSWWYGPGWRDVSNSFSRRIKDTMELFSVGQLSKTLFAPWRKIMTYPGASLADRFKAWGDNVFSRGIGFVVRIFVLLGALIALLIIGLLTVLEILLWPLLPVAIPGCLIAGLII